MAIEVRSGSTTHTFADAKRCSVSDGHLYILGEGNATLGVFAPGKWDNGVVADSTETKRAKAVVD